MNNTSAFLLHLDHHKLNEINANTGGRNRYIPKGFVYGPFLCDCYVVEYCKTGGFDLTVDGTSYTVSAGDLYLVPPFRSIKKQFRSESTATIWAAVGGVKLGKYLRALGFSDTNVVFPVKLSARCAELLEQLVDSLELHEELTVSEVSGDISSELIRNPDFSNHLGMESDLLGSSLVCAFLAELVHLYGDSVDSDGKSQPKIDYVNETIRYIDANYSHNISVEGIARHLGITRNYLFSIFREQVGISVQQYLMQVRMNAACEFLSNPDVMVQTVAVSVGYEPLTFSRAFKKFMGVSPGEYQKQKSNLGS